MHEQKTNYSNLAPEKVILKRAAITSVVLLVLSSINPTAILFGKSFADEASIYLSQEDIDYNNLALLISTDEGFLVKNMPQSQEAVVVERVDFVDHEVQKHEKLETIAQMYGLTPETLIWENNIVNIDSISPGQRLRIPPTNGVSHEVKSGDTISGLAAKYEADSSRITLFNHLDTKGLKVGDKIFIPNGKRITTQLVADNSTSDDQAGSNAENVTTTTKIAHLDTDVNIDLIPTETPAVEPEEEQSQRPTVPDARPNLNIAPIQGVESTTNIVQGADPQIRQPEQPKSTEQTIQTNTEAPPVPNTPAPATAGQWGKVTVGSITQGYTRGHYALDIANRERPVIWASADGVIETAGWGGAYGNYIIINHQNGYKTLYAHNSDLYVKVGDQVAKGQVIAQMGNTGRVFGATGIHLHYECHYEGERINPYSCME